MRDEQDLPREVKCECGDGEDHVAYRNQGRSFICPRSQAVQIYKPRAPRPEHSMTFREIVDGVSFADLDDGLGAPAEVTFDLKTGATTLTPVSH